MAIEKLSDRSQVTGESVPFTQINNHVINNIKNADAFLVWAYLFSKSANWKVIKQDIINKYGYGSKKLKQIFSYLARSKLIEYVQNSCPNGQFGQVDILVLNGSKFDKNQQYNVVQPQVPKTAPPVNRTSGNSRLLNKEVTKERNNEINISRPSDDGQNRFNDFWKKYPRKENKKRAEQIWIKNKLDRVYEDIVFDLNARSSNDWYAKEKQYIPLPDKYLSDERWKDEISIERKDKVSVNHKTLSEPYAAVNKMEFHVADRKLNYDNPQPFSNGSKNKRDNTGGIGMRKATDFILPN